VHPQNVDSPGCATPPKVTVTGTATAPPCPSETVTVKASPDAVVVTLGV
jgi:hypothetical protein